MQTIKKVKTPKITEKKILNYLKQQESPVSFYTLYKDLNFTSGKAQSAIKRLVKKNKVYLRKRVNRFENMVWHKDFDIESKFIELKEQDEVVFPFRLNRTIARILQEIPELTSKYKTLSELLKDAIVYYFQESLSPNLKRKAVLQAIEKGTIPKNIGKQILGE
ncbi:MAG: hypothetical protein EU539_05980 [Promethearchaeota archaeon]|nr:MAG: hypothetical protein EU539_05980 [Candidatus Lokiarchaeota archaeon]